MTPQDYHDGVLKLDDKVRHITTGKVYDVVWMQPSDIHATSVVVSCGDPSNGDIHHIDLTELEKCE